MIELPDYVVHTLGNVWNMSYEKEVTEAFLGRWGGLDRETFSRVLREGEGEDRVFAIFALGYTGTPQAHEQLLPFLQSRNPMERWASALCLGKMQEERALPVLIHMLTEFLPPHEQYLSEALVGKRKVVDWHYDLWRIEVARILGTWNIPPLVPPLRQALQALLKLEHAEPFNDGTKLHQRQSHAIGRTWKRCQDEIVYALGHLRAFGALTGLEEVKWYLRLWTVHLIMGYLHDRYSDVVIAAWEENPELKEEVSNILEQQFGLSAEERKRYLTLYQEKVLEPKANPF